MSTPSTSSSSDSGSFLILGLTSFSSFESSTDIGAASSAGSVFTLLSADITPRAINLSLSAKQNWTTAGS